MCGIAGFLDATLRNSNEHLRATATSMGDTLQHRGPDDAGIWVDAATGMALAHRRLSILDLSPAGHQPMLSASGRYVIVFNGEIYNFQQLREELEKSSNAPLPFRGHSDTEVLLACFESWNVKRNLSRLNGMFAFALWDRRESHPSLVPRPPRVRTPSYSDVGWRLLFVPGITSPSAHPPL